MPAYKLTSLDTVAGDADNREDDAWLWPGRIPAGSLGMLDGDPGLGKSFVTMDLAARVTKGDKWPDGTKGGKPANVLVLAKEDSKRTLVKRLGAAGADFKRVLTLDDVGGRAPTFPDDILILEDVIRKRKVKLVIIDPIMSYLSVTAYQGQQVRKALDPLSELAGRTDTTILFVRHLTKTGGRNSKMAGGGAMDILGACRFGYLINPDPDDAKARVFAVTKFNLDEEPESMEYRFEKTTAGTIIKWSSETVKWTADDLLSKRQMDTEKKEELDEVCVFLSDYLHQNGGAVGPKDLFKDGAEAGFTQKMLRTAKAKLGVKSYKSGATWWWVENGYEKRRLMLLSGGRS